MDESQQNGRLRDLPETLLRWVAWAHITEDRRIGDYNAEFMRFAGFDGDVHSQRVREAFARSPAVVAFLDKVLEEGDDVLSRIVHFERGGSLVHVHMEAIRVREGRFSGWFVTCRDIGNVVALENQVSRTDKLFVVGQVATGIAHEIRNPLTTIRGFLQMLHHDFHNEGRTRELRYTELMLAEIEQVNALLEQLLLLSKPPSLQLRMIRIDDVVKRAMELLRLNRLMDRVRADAVVSPTPLVWADQELLAHAVLLLMYNAVEAMENGGDLTVSAYYDEREQVVRLDVADSGPGVPHYMMDRIFDAFYTTKKGGVGLGLPICRRILSDFGGDVRVSAKGFGSTFSVTLPTAPRGAAT